MKAPSTRRLARAITLALAFDMLLLLLLSAPVQRTQSAPLFHYEVHVTTPLDEYDSPGNGFCSLREAITTFNTGTDFGGCLRQVQFFNGGPTIFLPANIYTLTRSGTGEDLNATGDLDVLKSYNIEAGGAISATVAGADGWDDRIFDIL